MKPGSTVRFVIHNADPIDHEFIIGPPETHDIHERGEPHFHTGAVPGEVTVPAGATVETTWTFGPSGSPDVAYGCHLAGHWDLRHARQGARSADAAASRPTRWRSAQWRGRAAIPLIGLFSLMLPVEPKKPASPKAKMPPSWATSQ